MIKNVKGSINDFLISRLSRTFEGKPWYGKSVKSLLDLNKAIPSSGLAIINHMIAWREFVIAALEGNEYKIELDSEADWPLVDQPHAEVITKLENSQKRLIETIRSFSEDRWEEKPKDAKYTYYFLVDGIIDHDIYHIGQVALRSKEQSQ